VLSGARKPKGGEEEIILGTEADLFSKRQMRCCSKGEKKRGVGEVNSHPGHMTKVKKKQSHTFGERHGGPYLQKKGEGSGKML